MMDKLVEIDRKNWVDLRNLYQEEWPKHMIGYYTVNNFVRWTEQEPDIRNLHIYSLNGDWTDGTFVVIHRYQLFLNSISPSTERLYKLLQLVDWSHGFQISTFLHRHRDIVLQVIEEKKLGTMASTITLLYHLSKEKAVKLEVKVPEGVTLGPLDDSHAQIADNVWPHKRVGSLYLLRTLAKYNSNVGAFTEDGKLIAWSFRLQAGPLGALQVDNDYRGQGYGSLVARGITRKVGEAGDDVSACVYEINSASRKIFEGCGFTVVDKVYWVRTFPTVPFEWKEEFD